MNRIKTKIALIGVSIMLFVTSCVSKLPTPDYLGIFTSVGDVVWYDNNSNFDIVIDNYDTVRTLNTSILKPDKVPTGTRVSFKAKVYETTNGSPMVYLADLNSIALIPVVEPLLLSDVKDDESLGEDQIEVLQFTVSDKYINTMYRIRQNDTSIKHKISYVIDDVNPLEQGVLNVIMRHNMNGDSPSIEAAHMLSCNIEKHINAATSGELKINLHYSSQDGVAKVKTTTWKKDWWKQ